MSARVAITLSVRDGDRAAYVDALRVLSFANLLWLRSRHSAAARPPLVLQSGVVFRSEPQEGSGVELYQTIPEVIAQGWGDCDDLTGWRVAELWYAGEHAAQPELVQLGPRAYHAVVRRASGATEDIAALVRALERR